MRRDPPKQTSNIARRRAQARDVRRSGYVDRRREIVKAAAQVFKERGFRGTTLNHVAEAMGADRASLYYYVGSKEELFQEIVGEAASATAETATAIRDDEALAPEKLRRLILALMESYAQWYPVLYVLIQENLDHVDPERGEWAQGMKQLNNNVVDAMIEIVEAGQREGTIRDSVPAWLHAYGILGMVGWTNRWFNPEESPVTAIEIGSAFADAVLDGMVVETGKRSRRPTSKTPANAAGAPKPVRAAARKERA